MKCYYFFYLGFLKIIPSGVAIICESGIIFLSSSVLLGSPRILLVCRSGLVDLGRGRKFCLSNRLQVVIIPLGVDLTLGSKGLANLADTNIYYINTPFRFIPPNR